MLHTPYNRQIKVLIVFANPQGTSPLRLGTEDRTIREAIRLSPHRDNISVTVCHAATIHDLRRSLLSEEFQIVHISGHGTDNGLILENELGGEQRIPQAALAELLQAHSPSVQCVLLNACYSTSQGKLMSLGIPFTIAMEGPIDDQAAIEFSRGFYDALGAGRAIDFAYEEGCRTVKLIVPNTPFVSQLLAQDNHLRCILLQKDEQLPAGYACISLSTGRVAIKPTRYQSLQMLLDDLYLDHFAYLHKPYTYGSAWVLASDSDTSAKLKEAQHTQYSIWWPGGHRRLVVPWNWQQSDNKGKSISQFDLSWAKEPPQSYGIEAGSYWVAIRPEAETIGLATNCQEFAEYLSHSLKSYPIHPKRLNADIHQYHYHLQGRWVPTREFQSDNYNFLFTLTNNPEETDIYLEMLTRSSLSGRGDGYSLEQEAILELFER